MPDSSRLCRAFRFLRGPLASLLLLAVGTATCAAGDGVLTVARLTEFGQLPEFSGGDWTRLGTAPAVLLSGERLFLNDNTPTGRVAYQGLLGRIEAADRVTVRARVSVISNHDGDGAILELSRPGVELVLRLRRSRVDLMERTGQRDLAWLGSANVDLSVSHEVALFKEAATVVGSEDLARVQIDGVEVLRAMPRGGGTLGVGRIVMGSLSYRSYGASVWEWVDVRVERVSAAGRLRTESMSVGGFKARWSGTQ